MITDLGQVTESRLTWPDNKPRSAQRIGSPFKRTQVDREQREIENELGRWGVGRFIISRNHHRIYAGDPGAAVWWIDPKKRDMRVLACDKWQTLGDNMHAIALTLAAMRGLERWGAYTAEQAAEGARLALPPPDSERIDWPTILEVQRSWPLEAIKLAWERKAERAHPDRGGSAEEMARINAAWDAAKRERAA